MTLIHEDLHQGVVRRVWLGCADAAADMNLLRNNEIGIRLLCGKGEHLYKTSFFLVGSMCHQHLRVILRFCFYFFLSSRV